MDSLMRLVVSTMKKRNDSRSKPSFSVVRRGEIYKESNGKEKVMERHRHRYEINPALVLRLEAAGLEFVGRNTDASGERMEVCELSRERHPYFMAVQFHPEFTSRPEKANPLFLGLLKAAKENILLDRQ